MANFFSASFWKARFFKAFGGQAAADPGAMSGTFSGSSSWTGTLSSASTAERKTIDLVFVPDPAVAAKAGRWIRGIPESETEGDDGDRTPPTSKRAASGPAQTEAVSEAVASSATDQHAAALLRAAEDDEDLILALLLAA
jgi:hypothetical protein